MAAIVPANLVVDFEQVLSNIIGMTNAQCNIVTNNGITTIDTLSLCDDEFVLGMHTGNQKLNILVKSCLQALLNWTYDKECTLADGMTVDVTEFTAQICTEWMRCSKKRSRAKEESTKKEDVKMPEAFDGRKRTWKKKKRELLAYLGHKQSRQEGVPLSYVIYINDDQDFTIADDAPELLQRIATMECHGEHWEADNIEMYNILAIWTAGGNAKTYVDSFQQQRDGRGAWLNLHACFDGLDARENITRLAWETIRNAHFHSPTPRFTLEDYCNKHLQSNQLLDGVKQPSPGRQQGDDFLKGIKNENIIAIKAQILADPIAREDLSKATTLFKALYESIMSTSRELQTNHNDRRGIGAAYNRGGREINRSGRNNHGGRGNRGGWINNRTNQWNRGGWAQYGRGKPNQDDGYLNPAALNSMTPGQCCMYFIGREQVRQQNNSSQHDEQKNESQMVQAESRNDNRVNPPSHIQLQNTNSSVPHQNDELTNTSALDQFGQAHRQLNKTSCSQHRVSTNNHTLCAAHFKPPPETPDLTG